MEAYKCGSHGYKVRVSKAITQTQLTFITITLYLTDPGIKMSTKKNRLFRLRFFWKRKNDRSTNSTGSDV